MSLWGILLIAAPLWFAVTIVMAIVLGRSVQRADREELGVQPVRLESTDPGEHRLAS